MKNEDLKEIQKLIVENIMTNYGCCCILTTENDAKIDFGRSKLGEHFTITIEDKSELVKEENHG